jgi:hypothetical protein
MQTLKISFGDGLTVEITGEHETELFKKAGFWLSLPKVCPLCGSGIRFDYRNPNKQYDYYMLVCTGPGRHEINLGEKTGSHDLYYDAKKTWGTFRPGGQYDDPGPATPPAAMSPAPAAFDNSPDSSRGRMIARIVWFVEALSKRSIVWQGDVGKLGGMSDDDLIRIGKQLSEKARTAGIVAG